MQDFELKFGKFKGQKVSTILPDVKYFYWLYHRLAERRDTDEQLEYMESLWPGDISKLTKKKEIYIKRKEIDHSKIEPSKILHHGPEGIRIVKISKITQEMEDLEDDWVAENHEMIMATK